MEAIWIDYHANSAREFISHAIAHLLRHRRTDTRVNWGDDDAVHLLTHLDVDTD